VGDVLLLTITRRDVVDIGVFSDHENPHKTYVAGEVILEGRYWWRENTCFAESAEYFVTCK